MKNENMCNFVSFCQIVLLGSKLRFPVFSVVPLIICLLFQDNCTNGNHLVRKNSKKTLIFFVYYLLVFIFFSKPVSTNSKTIII